MISRRKFIKAGVMAGVAVTLPIRWLGSSRAYPFSQSPRNIRKFVVPLPGLGPDGIPVLSPRTEYDPCTGKLTDFYQIRLGQYKQRLHPDLPRDTTLWGYADAAGHNHRYLGGVIEAKKGRPVHVTAYNKLPPKHPLPVDTTLVGADGAENRTTVHLHGGFVPWTSDGNPFSWFTHQGETGVNFLNPGPVPGSAQYYYPNDQSARMMWFHDHALGITRLNVYAGLVSAYLLRDDIERALIGNGIIPSREIPLIIQDKTFVDGSDRHYRWGKPGDLWYPYLYEPDRWEYGGNATPPVIGGALPPPVPSVVPEFFSDTMLVNGTCYPFVEVEQRHYRFRILNGSQARFYNLQLYYADGSGKEANLAKAGPRIIQIGTEGGFLPFPVALNNPPAQIAFDDNGNAVRYTLLLAPAERADVIIDFSNVPSGAKLVLYNDAPAPFPGGSPLNDYFTGGDFGTAPGFGPNTRTLLQFRVLPRRGAADHASLSLLEKLALQGGHLAEHAYHSLLPAVERLDTRRAARVRDLTLNEDFDEYGRLLQRLGTATPNGTNNQGIVTFGRNYTDNPTETPHAGDLEIWRIFNLTADTHPIHFHLVNVQVLSRQQFNVDAFASGSVVFTGPAAPPDPNERGWKETVRMNPGECTVVAMKFDLPRVPFHVPLSPRTPGGYEYVWHCHILEHEEHDMMRPLVVIP